MSSIDSHQQPSKRDSIIAAASDLFLKFGLNDVTTDRIAEKAGVGKGTIFHHFKSKENLINEVFKQMIGSVELGLQAAASSTLEPKELLRQIAKDNLRLSYEEPALTQLMLQFISKFDYFHPESVDESISETLEKFMGMLYEPNLQNLFKDLGHNDPEVAIRIFFGILDGIGLQFHIQRGEIDENLLDRIVDGICDLFILRGKEHD